MDSNQMKLYTPDTNSFKMKDKNQHIQVFARVRPMNGQEKAKNSLTVLDCPGAKEVVVKERTSSNVTKTFTFDKVFGPNSKQIEVYKSVVAPLLEEVLLGYNCTVFAYGQTGTGKTFTMEGDRQYDSTLGWDKDPMSGIVPRALNQLFDELRMQKAEFTVRVSLLELYNEELFDLLASTEDMKLKNLRLYEDNTRKGSVVIQGLEEVTVHDKHEVYAIMERGAMKRQTAATLMNEKSSRSHTVFTVTVHIKESNMDGEELLKIGKLHLVDLAGSENIGRSGAVDKRAREAGSINQSLLTLGRVITALVERTPHVPYRESKLTRILQDSLGGRTKTSIIATVSPASINIEETLSTLDYAHRAKNITNRPEINQKLTKKAILKAYTEEIEQLKKDLLATREKNGFFVDKGNYERMTSQIEAQGQDISERIALIKSLEETVEKKEEEVESMKVTLTEKEEYLILADAVIEKLKDDLRRTETELKLTQIQRDEKEHLLSKHLETEKKLSKEASTLLETANTTTVNLEQLYSKLERKRRVEDSNLSAGKRFRGDVTDDLMSSIENFVAFRAEHAKFCGEHRLLLEFFLQNKKEAFEVMKIALSDLSEDAAFRLTNQAKLFDMHKDFCNKWDQKAHISANEEADRFNQFYINVSNVFNQFHDRMSVNIAAMMQFYETLFRDTYNFSSQVDTMTQLLFNRSSKLIDMVFRSVTEFINVHDNDMEILQNEINALVAAGGNHGRRVDEEIKNIEERLTALKVAQQDMYKENNDKNFSLASKIENCNQNAKYFAVNLNSVLLDQNAATGSLSLTETVEAFQTEKKEERNKFMKLTFDTQGYVKLQRDQANYNFIEAEALFDHWLLQLQSERRLVIDDATATSLIVDKDSKDFMSHVQNKAIELEKEGQSCMDEDTSMVVKFKDDLHQECQWVSDWSDAQSNKVTRQLGMVSEFFDSTYLVDLPSGATPQRKVYEYPSKLSMTSPHESILGRFRKQMVSSPRKTSGNLFFPNIEEDRESSEGSVEAIRFSFGGDSDASSSNETGNGQIDAASEAVSKDTPNQAVAGENIIQFSKGFNKENSATSSKIGKHKGNASRQGVSKEQSTKSKDVLKSKNAAK